MGLSSARIDYFQTLRELRNKDLYTGSTHISDAQAVEAVEEADRLFRDLTDWFAQRGKSNE